MSGARRCRGGESLTLSMGVATYPADASDERDLLRHADRAMYHAKSKGKNQ
ncbi:MAG: diguanylate cyclase, partial [Thermoanaerobaculia bacterium]